jgi:hypothetical protein
MSSERFYKDVAKETAIQTVTIQEHASDSATNVEAGSIVSLPKLNWTMGSSEPKATGAAMPNWLSMMSALGLGFTITNSWVGYLSNFAQNLVYRGLQSVILGLLVALVVQLTIMLGLSEMVFAFP